MNMKKKKKSKKKKVIRVPLKVSMLLFFLSALLFIASFYISQVDMNQDRKLQESIITLDNKTYKQYLDNYYDIEYGYNDNGLVIQIKNDCVQASTSRGDSMKPYIGNETIMIYDTCFPKEDLKVGDIIIFLKEWTQTNYVRHRIVEINHEDRWVRTQGDNPVTNPSPDDMIDFDRIAGKDIGHLDVLVDKKVVRQEFINETNVMDEEFVAGDLVLDVKCICSSSGLLKFCESVINIEKLKNDTFIQNNDFREEYCKDNQKNL